MEVSGLLHSLATLPLRKEPHRANVDAVEKRKIFDK
jgi:hypothetical protein